MASFLNQLRWEIYRLWARPRSWIGFGACLLFELIASALFCLPGVRASLARYLWKSQNLPSFLGTSPFSGPSIAAHIMGESMTFIGTLALALVAADLVAGEAEEGTLRAALCRPVSRTSLFAQKLIAGAIYAAALAIFITASSILTALLFHENGPLIIVASHENIIGTFSEPLLIWHRFWLASLLLSVSAYSGMLLGFLFSSLPVKPAAAVALALTIFFADDIVRTEPSLSFASEYCLTTRLIAWRQMFNNEISWLKVRRLYREMLWIDTGLIAAAGAAFLRRDTNPR